MTQSRRMMELNGMAGHAPEIAIASIERGKLSALLTAVHRGGYGHVTRVIDPEKGEVTGQLRRAGATIPHDFRLTGNDCVAVMIAAAARTPAAIDLVGRYGAAAVWTAFRTATPSPLLAGSRSSRSPARPTPPPESLTDD